MNRHREHTEAAWRKYGRKLWKFGGSYGLGIALMLILLVLTFAGTLHQVRLAPSLGSEAAIESFFGAPYVLIPLAGSTPSFPCRCPAWALHAPCCSSTCSWAACSA